MKSLRWLVLTFAWLAVFGSAVGAIWAKHQSRSLFVELQRLEKQRDRLDEEWGRWKIEQGMDAAHNRVERVARQDLKMVIPQPQQVSQVRASMPTVARHDEVRP